MENSDFFGTKIAYSIKKLIAVNSISYCYIELPIDKHCALFGGNNVGKTSLLNALKLHFYPEITLNDCEKKFAFKSAKGELYTTEQSYQYYFPTPSSFLILEAENIHGIFCILLFQSERSFGYQRLALPCSYDEIREFFWDIDNTEINNGLGSPVKGLEKPIIDRLCKQYKKDGAVILKKISEIKEKLFNHNPLQKEKSRYCLVPLKEEGTEREITAFRQLMNFSFEIAKTDTKGLTETFATIIESDKINSKSQLHQDLQKILDDFNSLRNEQDKLKQIENKHNDFNELNNIHHDFIKNRNKFINTFVAYSDYLENKKKELQNEIDPVNLRAGELFNKKEELLKKENELKSKFSGLNGELKTLNKDIKSCKEKIEHCVKIKQEYPKNCSFDDIVEALKASEKELNTKIDTLSDNQRAIDDLSNKITIKKAKNKQLNSKNNALESQENLFTNYVSDHSSIVLTNLNSLFSELTVKPDELQLKSIEEFGELFSIANEKLIFLNELFDSKKIKRPEEIKKQLQQEINDLEKEIYKLDSEIQELGNITKAPKAELEEQMQNASKELKKTQEDLRLINALEDTKLQEQEKSSQAIKVQIDIEKIKTKQGETEQLLQQAKVDFSAENEKLESLDKDIQNIDGLLQRLKLLNLENLEKTEQIEIINISENDINNLEGDKAKIDKLNENLNEKINEFILNEHFNFPIETPLVTYNKDQQKDVLTVLTNIFSGLSEQKETLESRIIEHNKMTDTKITELTSNRDYINTFINRVNKQFEKYQISNLQNIKVEIHLDSRFEELIKELNNTNLHTTDIHDDALYQRLNVFCEEFFIGIRGNRILEMRKIITGIKYSYQKQHQNKRENKDQSTGTNALINCTLLTILLGDLLAKDTQLTLPVIFDEFTMLDEHNQRTAIQTTTDHGFALFCASATDTAEVVAVVDHYIHLDDCHVNTTYDEKGERDVVFHHYQERLYEAME